MAQSATALLLQWLHRQLDQVQQMWLNEQLAELRDDSSDTILHIALGMAPRRLGKSVLKLTGDDLIAADQAISAWDPSVWSVPDAARVLFLASLPDDAPRFAARFKSLCQTSDMTETIGLYSGLAVYPHRQALQDQVGEGLRSNIKSVFEAIAHRNPYPRDVFDEHRWNHMLIKALFVDSRLSPVVGLDQRVNVELSRIMRDFAHERWAAGRIVPFEIWRCVGPLADDDAMLDLERALADNDIVGRQASALALSTCPHEKAAQLLQTVPELHADIKAGNLSWASLAGSNDPER